MNIILFHEFLAEKKKNQNVDSKIEKNNLSYHQRYILFPLTEGLISQDIFLLSL